ncbi:hypothetical protein ABPG77_009445 [Micractinium sp. CCAP 211/92]
MASRIPRLPLHRLPRIPSQQVLLLSSGRGARRRLSYAAALLLAAVALLALQLALRPGPRYVLVIDAGSSGTRMFAYAWRDARRGPVLTAVPSTAAPHAVPRRSLPGKRAYQRVETEPGLDQFVDDAPGLQGRALGPLLQWAEAAVPRRQWASTPVFLFGTAGLRRLSQEQQGQLLAGVRRVLGSSAFRFSPPWARIISGADEGVYGWIALNYLEGRLQAAAAAALEGGPAGVGAAGTLGVLDLGGSSLEVTFAAGSVPRQEDAVNATLLGATHQLYAHVHHHYGLNDAFDRSVSILLARQLPTAGNGSHGTGGGGGGIEKVKSPDRIDQQQQQQQQQQQRADGIEENRNERQQQPQQSEMNNAAKQPGEQPGQQHEEESQEGAQASDKSDSVASGRAAAERAAVVAPVRLPPAAGTQDGSTAVTGGRRRLQAPAALRRQLLAAPDGVETSSGAPIAGQFRQQAERQGGQQGEQRGGALEELPAVNHPCLHAGYRSRYHRLRGDGADLPDPAEVVLAGRPDFAACQELAAAVVNASVPCPAPPCALGARQPASAAHHEFVALTGFFVVFRFFRLSPTAGMAALEQAGASFCGLSWAQVQAQHGGEIMVEDYCFRAPYIAALVRHGLLLRDEQLRIGGGDVGWTLGAALAEGYRLAGLGQDAGGTVFSLSGVGPLLLLLSAASAAAALAVLTAPVCRRLLTSAVRSGGGGGRLLGWLLSQGSFLRKLSTKRSGELISLGIEPSPPSTDRSELSTVADSSIGGLAGLSGGVSSRLGSPLPTARSPQRLSARSGQSVQFVLPGGLAGMGLAAAVAATEPTALAGSPSWAAQQAVLGAVAPVLASGREASYSSNLNRLGRSRTYSRRSLGISGEGE